MNEINVTASNLYLAIRFINEDEKSSWQSHLPKTADFACICNVATECGISKKLILELQHLKRQIFIDDAVAEDMLSVAGRQICHPYWKFYAQLASLETAKLAPFDLKDKVKYLMLTVGLDFKERLKLNAMMILPWFKVSMIEESFPYPKRAICLLSMVAANSSICIRVLSADRAGSRKWLQCLASRTIGSYSCSPGSLPD